MIFINRLFERIARKGRIGILDIFPIIYIIIIIIIIIVIIHCTHLTVLLAKILQLIWVISTKHRLVRARAMHDFHGVFVVIFFSTIPIRFGFCEIRYNQGLGKCYKPLSSVDRTYLDLHYSGKKKRIQ